MALPREPKLTSLRSLRALLTRHGIRPSKRLGQHFLVNERALERIVAALELDAQDMALEVGAGVGTLTRALAPARGVVAVEADRRLLAGLRETVGEFANVRVVCADFMALNLAGLRRGPGQRRWKVAGNLPYYLTSPILVRLIEHRDRFERFVITVQQEVAERLASGPGPKEYGSLSVLAQCYTQVEMVARFSGGCFWPAPDVDSALVRLRVRERPQIPEELEPYFFPLVRAAFGQRRKTLLNALAAAAGLGLSKEQAEDLLTSASIAPTRRGETLSIPEFEALARALRERRLAVDA